MDSSDSSPGCPKRAGKSTRNQHNINHRKGPSKLALKKSIRRSSVYDRMPRTFRNEKLIAKKSSSIISATTFSSSGSGKAGEIVPTSAEVPDREADFKRASMDRGKHKRIEDWVLDVNEASRIDGCNNLRFSDVSVIMPDDGKRRNGGFVGRHAMNSTFLDEKAAVAFDDLFIKPSGDRLGDVQENNSVIVIDSEDEASNKCELLDELRNKSRKSDKPQAPPKPSSQEKGTIEEKEDSILSSEAYLSQETEKILDDLYGTVWRKNKHQLLSKSERKPKKKLMSDAPKMPQTELKPKQLSKWEKKETESSTPSGGNFHQQLTRKCLNFGDCSNDENNRNKINVADKFNDLVRDRDMKALKLPVPEKKKINKKAKVLGDGEEFQGNKSAHEYFVTSLSSDVPLAECHPEAAKFRRNYKKLKEDLTRKLFSLFNESVFEKEIPESTAIEWSPRLTKSGGYCSCKKLIHRDGSMSRTVSIKLSTKVLSSADRLRDTLLHEMCHAAVWIVNEVSDGHGPCWQSWAARAMRRYPHLPKVSRCHDYKITTKYTYKCVKCGYSLGRHTKSLDIERYSCGICRGRFEVLLNKVSKRGSIHPVPATPKGEAKGFARFVQENFEQHKSPALKTADVMKILGKKFREMKMES